MNEESNGLNPISQLGKLSVRNRQIATEIRQIQEALERYADVNAAVYREASESGRRRGHDFRSNR